METLNYLSVLKIAFNVITIVFKHIKQTLYTRTRALNETNFTFKLDTYTCI